MKDSGANGADFPNETYSIRKFNLRQLYADKSKKTNGASELYRLFHHSLCTIFIMATL